MRVHRYLVVGDDLLVLGEVDGVGAGVGPRVERVAARGVTSAGRGRAKRIGALEKCVEQF